jgi:hypothetical protein
MGTSPQDGARITNSALQALRHPARSRAPLTTPGTRAVIFAAAANSSSWSPVDPGACDNVITVSATEP